MPPAPRSLVSLRPALVALPALLFLVSCKETPVDPTRVPVSIVAVDGLTQDGAHGAAVGITPTFEIHNADGDPIQGISFTVTVLTGGGAVTGKPSSTGAGPTPIGTWTLGPNPGPQTVRVSRGSLTPVVFTATTPLVGIVSGGNQTALAGTTLANPVRALVVDATGTPLPGATVTWVVAAGGGSLNGTATTTTDANGRATAPPWTLGKNGGTQQLRAEYGAFEAVATANIQSSLVFELRWVGTPPAGATLDAFTRAADRIRATIVGGVGPIGMPGGFNNVTECDSQLPSTPIPFQTIPGVIIYAAVIPIDGGGNVLGSAGPCLSRDLDFHKTALGTMRFDSADMPALVADGRIDAVILHEMLHVMGIGTNWLLNDLLEGAQSADSRFLGALARNACATTNGGTTTCATSVPVHSSDGPGSRDAHWRESVFTTELMTPFIGAGAANPMSAMSVQSLADIGYTVNPNVADDFAIASLMASKAQGDFSAMVASGALLRLPPPTTPVFAVDPQGRWRRLRAVK